MKDCRHLYPGSVADIKVGLGYGNLGKCSRRRDIVLIFAGHESFVSREGAIGIAEKRKQL